MDGFLTIAVLLFILLLSAFKVLREYERGVIFLLGKFWKVKGPGLIIVIPGIQKMIKVSLRTVVMDVPPQDIITRDNVTVKVNAVVYFRVIDPNRAIIEVEDFLYATSQLSQTTLRSILGQSQLDDLLSNRDEINSHLQRVIDEQTEPWGVKVANVEVKNVDLPQEMQRALAKQAEAERERRAKVINAMGEFEAAEQICAAADRIGAHPPALQLRYLQTLVDLSTDRNTMTFIPFPIEMLEGFQKLTGTPKKDGQA
jgi:regulator of protease activity HflC (stomatin/prohibitin superfamily)